MRTILWALVVGLPFAWAISIWWLIRTPGAAVAWTGLGISDVVQVVAAAFTLVGIYIAVASYQYAVAAGKEQGVALDAQLKALNGAREALAKVQVATEASTVSLSDMRLVLDKSREALVSQLALAKQQREEEQRRLARRPQIEVDFGDLTAEKRRPGDGVSAVRRNGRVQIDILVRNVGDAGAIGPVVLISTKPPSVSPNPRQFAGQGLTEWVPFSTSKGNYRYALTVEVPADLSEFSLTVEIYASNLDRQAITIPVVVIEK